MDSQPSPAPATSPQAPRSLTTRAARWWCSPLTTAALRRCALPASSAIGRGVPSPQQKKPLGDPTSSAYMRCLVGQLPAAPFRSVSDCPGGINYPQTSGDGRPPKASDVQRQPQGSVQQ